MKIHTHKSTQQSTNNSTHKPMHKPTHKSMHNSTHTSTLKSTHTNPRTNPRSNLRRILVSGWTQPFTNSVAAVTLHSPRQTGHLLVCKKLPRMPDLVFTHIDRRMDFDTKAGCIADNMQTHNCTYALPQTLTP